MSYTPTTWTTGDTITATAMNKIENGIADAGSGGGFDLVIKMSTTLPQSYSTFEVVSGDTATNLYDKLSDGTPLTIMLFGCDFSGGSAITIPWIGYAHTTSVTDTIFINCTGNTIDAWPSYYTLQYDSNGITYA